MKKGLLFALLLFMVIGSVYAAGQTEDASDYPTGPISLVIPYDAGGSADIESRLITDMVSANIEQPINLEFKPGGANIPGTMEVVNAPADGKRIFWWATPVIAINPQLRDTPYTHEDLQPVVTVIDNPVMMFVRNDSDIDSLDDFLDEVKNRNVTVGINVIGSVPFMAAAQLATIGDVSLNYITQQTNPAAAVALMGGHVDVAFGTGPQLKAYSDDIRAIALFSNERNPIFPDVPTAIEQGYDVIAPVQSGIAVKQGTPEEIVSFLEDAYLEVLASDEYQSAAEERGFFVAPESMWSREATEANWEQSVEIYGEVIETMDAE